jgi:hypothetical protein
MDKMERLFAKSRGKTVIFRELIAVEGFDAIFKPPTDQAQIRTIVTNRCLSTQNKINRMLEVENLDHRYPNTQRCSFAKLMV